MTSHGPTNPGNSRPQQQSTNDLAGTSFGGQTSPLERAIRQERAELIKEIRLSPDSNAPRIAYANLLERSPLHMTDGARATLIRLQASRADRPASSEETTILSRFERSWKNAIGCPRSVEWDRGFIVGVAIHPLDFCATSTQLAAEPITKVSVSPFWRCNSSQLPADPAWYFEAMLANPFFRESISRLEVVIGEAPTVYSLLRNVHAGHALREVHFLGFTDTRSTILPSGNRFRDELNRTYLMQEVGGANGEPSLLRFCNTTISGIPR